MVTKVRSRIPMSLTKPISNDFHTDWSVGPPKGENVFQIKKITMYYNTADDASSNQEVQE